MKFFLFIKKYWLLFVAVVVSIVGLIFLKKKPSDLIDDLTKINKAHEDEVKKIENAHKKADKKKEDALKQHDKLEADIVASSEKKLNDLNADIATDAENLTKLGNQDIDKLASEVSKVTGYKVILPKDE